MTCPLLVDSFAGGGGASTGIEQALGRPVDIAINHDPDAIRMHSVNHPHTLHYCEDVWQVDPEQVCQGRPVGLLWASPDCKHFSKAKGAKPVDKRIRGLAWVVLRWAAKVRPRVIILENVEEFQTWGPVRRGRPVKTKAGQTFQKFVSQLRGLGYRVEWRTLVAADYGAATSRCRFFLIARCDGLPIVWHVRSHAPADSVEVKLGLKRPWRSAAEIIDWDLPTPSVFASREEVMARFGLTAVRPLSEKTLRRIILGIDRHTLRSGQPFLIQYHSERAGEAARGQSVSRPLMTIDAAPRYGLVTASLVKYYGNDRDGQEITAPLHTVTAKDRIGLAAVHLVKLKGTEIGGPVTAPLPTVTAGGGHHGLVTLGLCRITADADPGRWPEIRALLNRWCGYDLTGEERLLLQIGGEWYGINDIGLRMLTPRELYNASGFPADYIIDRDADGKVYSRTAQVARVGNAVPPPFARALVAANLPGLRVPPADAAGS